MKTIFEVAQELARLHKENDPDIKEIWMFKDPDGKEIRLLEVSTSVGTTGEILPFRFAPNPPEVPFPVNIILVSPDEKHDLDQGELKLPEIWGPINAGEELLRAERTT